MDAHALYMSTKDEAHSDLPQWLLKCGQLWRERLGMVHLNQGDIFKN